MGPHLRECFHLAWVGARTPDKRQISQCSRVGSNVQLGSEILEDPRQGAVYPAKLAMLDRPWSVW
jgi:hypothetical protein